jgi:hypothetical protein
MTDTIGWIVRTETAGQHRYWKVGEVDSDRAAMTARYTASADVAKAITCIPSHTSPAFSVSSGVVTEVVWQSTPVPNTSEKFELEDQVGTGEVALGEVTFDIVVPEEGVRHAEGCYRIYGGNWHVCYLTNWHDGASWTGDPAIRSAAIFQSGISGASGIVPADWILNRKTIKKILAEAVGVDGWIEVSGPNSLILR